MNLSNRFGTKSKLLFGFGTIMFAIIVMVTVSFTSVNRINELHQNMIEIEHITIHFNRLCADETYLRAFSYELLFEKKLYSRDSLISKIKLKTSEIESSLVEIDNELISFPDQSLLLKDIAKNLKLNIIDQMTFTEIIRQGKIEEAHIYIDNTLIPSYQGNESKILILENDLDKISAKFSESYVSLIDTVNYTLLILGLSVILVACFIAITTIIMLKKI